MLIQLHILIFLQHNANSNLYHINPLKKPKPIKNDLKNTLKVLVYLCFLSQRSLADRFGI